LTNLADTLDIVLYNIFALVLKSPIILSDEKIYNEFGEIDLMDEDMASIRMHILEIYNENGAVDLHLLEKVAQNSGFFDIFVLLSSRTAPFIDKMSLESQVIDPKNLWKLWIKRYESELLKKEYKSVVSNVDHSQTDADFERARAYMSQITKVEFEIRNMLEEMFG